MLSRGGLGVLYVAGGFVNLLTFGLFDLPQVIFDTNDSAIRVAVALNGGLDLPAPLDGPTEADGDFPAILAFNELGGYIGSSWTHEKIPSGGFSEVIVDQAKGPGQQATYLQFFARKDAVCIAYISQQWADGQTRGWLGDMGLACGRDWYYSHIVVGNDGYSPSGYPDLEISKKRLLPLSCDSKQIWLTSKPFFRMHVDGRRP